MSPYIGPFVNSHKHTLWVTSCTAPAILVLLGKVVSDIYMATNEITPVFSLHNCIASLYVSVIRLINAYVIQPHAWSTDENHAGTF